METGNKSRKRVRGRRKNWKASSHGAPAAVGLMLPAVKLQDAGVQMTARERGQGLTPLHVACLHGNLTSVQHLLDSGLAWVNSGDSEGRRPLHAALSPRSAPNAAACLRHLLRHGAAVNLAAHSGQTPLHLAAAEGLLDCARILVEAGADVLARDDKGLTAFDWARIWRHREEARYLKSCMWQAEKKKEMAERTLVQDLYRELVEAAKQQKLNQKERNKEKVSEWAERRGLPLPEDTPLRSRQSRYHGDCIPPPERTAEPSRPWSIFFGVRPEKPLVEPDLRDGVTLMRGGGGGGVRRVRFRTTWDRTPRPAPDLPTDVLERALFPRAFPPRLVTAQHLDIREVPRRRRSASPWSEVAMHLAEEPVQPRHY